MKNLKECSRLIYMISRSVHSLRSIRYDVCNSPANKNVLLEKCMDFTFQCKFLSKLNNINRTDQSRKFSLSYESYAKEKNRGGKKKVVVAKVDLQEMNQYFNVNKLELQMKNALEAMKNDFIKNLSVRSSGGSIEEISVTFDEKEYRLQELVQIARKPNYVILNASAFPQALSQIIHAVKNSGMNLNPQQDGTKIAIPIPKVTKEHRENLSKAAKALFIKCRDNLKNIQNKQIKSLQNNSDIDEDMLFRLKAQIEAFCNKYVQEAEDILKTKQNELLG